MDFGWTAEQEAFRKTVRDFGRNELAPGYLERAQGDEFPIAMYRTFAALGLLGLVAPVEAGGQGADRVTAGIAAEELGYADFNCSAFLLHSGLVSELLFGLGSEEAWELAKRVIAGDTIVAVALTEPGAGSDLAAATTTARRVKGGWRLSGEKSSISLAANADAALVLARVQKDKGRPLHSLFVVDLNEARVARQVFRDPGFRPLGRGALAFDDVLLPEASCLVRDGQGFQAIMHLFDFSRVLIALMCIGCAQASLDEASEYAKVRHAFGRPIATFQGVAFPIAEHSAHLQATRLLCYEALWRRDQGLPHTKEAAMVKWLGPQVALAAAHDAMLLHGNVGYTTEAPFVQRMLDIMACEIGDGTAQIQKLVVAREILGREFRAY
jgi:cyclohexanecarboxyl-CoA dehydrogenase